MPVSHLLCQLKTVNFQVVPIVKHLRWIKICVPLKLVYVELCQLPK